MGSRRDVIVLAVVLFTLTAMALALRPAGDGSSDDRRVSTFLTGQYGAAALYALMDELDIEAVRQLQPWSADSARAALVVLAPIQSPVPREMQALLAWVRAGGTLIYGSGGDARVDAMLGLRLYGLLPDTLGALATVRWTGATALPQVHQWTFGVDSIPGFRRAFRSGSRVFRGDSADVLLRTRDGAPTVVVFGLGEGRVIAWSDASVLGNRALRDGGAALLFARLAAAAATDGGALRFDEYHHGYREANAIRALANVLTGTGGGRALLQAAAACIALLLLFGSRFGAPVREQRERRRSPLEHVQALAGAYHRADARPVARRLLVAGLERRLGRRIFGGREGLPPAALDGTAAGRRLKTEWERPDGDLAALAGAVDDFVLEVTRWK
jgi:hypothetical protein